MLGVLSTKIKKPDVQSTPVVKQEEPVVSSEAADPPKKKRKPKPKKQEPSVKVVNFEFNPNDPKLGSIELDWNKEFVDLLRLNGYLGLTDEDVVNRWLSDVCRNIAASDLQDDNVRYIQRKDLGDGKTEVS